MSDTNAELFDALTARLTEICESDFAYAIRTGHGDREQCAAGVSRVMKVTEALEPTYDDPAGQSLEIAYLDRHGVERVHFLWGVTLQELLRDTGVRVPEHKLTWTLTGPTP